MTARTLYEKRGRRYVPVQYYDPAALDGLPDGAHLVVVEPGGRYTRYSINPDHVNVLSTG